MDDKLYTEAFKRIVRNLRGRRMPSGISAEDIAQDTLIWASQSERFHSPASKNLDKWYNMLILKARGILGDRSGSDAMAREADVVFTREWEAHKKAIPEDLAEAEKFEANLPSDKGKRQYRRRRFRQVKSDD